MGSMRQVLAATAIILCGLLGAATLGYAAYIVSRDSVGIPVTKLDTPPQKLAPVARTTKTPAKPKPRTVANPPPPPAATTGESGDDHGGSRGGSGGSGGGHGGDD
jgi:hypothetical protein